MRPSMSIPLRYTVNRREPEKREGEEGEGEGGPGVIDLSKCSAYLR